MLVDVADLTAINPNSHHRDTAAKRAHEIQLGSASLCLCASVVEKRSSG